MPEYIFKNGISIQIPDGTVDLENKWADVQVQMSLVLFHETHQLPPPVVPREKKLDGRKTYWIKKRKREMEQRKKK